MARLLPRQHRCLDHKVDRIPTTDRPARAVGESTPWRGVALQLDPVVVTLAGEIDIAVEGLLRAVLESLAPLRLSWLMVDVRAVTFIDSAGVQPVLDAQRTAAGWNGRVELRGPCPSLELLLAAVDRVAVSAGSAPPARPRWVCSSAIAGLGARRGLGPGRRH